MTTDLSTLFAEQRNLLDKVARRFSRRFGTDPDETQAEAYYSFLDAVKGFDPARSTIEQRLQAVVWRRLIDWYRGHRKHLHRELPAPDHKAFVYKAPRPFDAGDFSRECSPTARLVVSLLTEPQAEYDQLYRSESYNANRPSTTFRRVIRKYLRSRYRLGYNEITAAFDEIGDGL